MLVWVFAPCQAQQYPVQNRSVSSYQQGPSSLDWTRLSSRYTHDVQGQRVDQFAAGMQPLSNERPDFQRSGYRHYRSTLQAGSSADNMHVVEEWGNPVRPYDEWRFPFRPYSAPYPFWGPQPVPFGGGLPPAAFNPYGGPNAWQPGFGGVGAIPGLGLAPGGLLPQPVPNGRPPVQPGAPYNPWASPSQQPNIQNPTMNGLWPNIDEFPQPRDEDFFRQPR